VGDVVVVGKVKRGTALVSINEAKGVDWVIDTKATWNPTDFCAEERNAPDTRRIAPWSPGWRHRWATTNVYRKLNLERYLAGYPAWRCYPLALVLVACSIFRECLSEIGVFRAHKIHRCVPFQACF